MEIVLTPVPPVEGAVAVGTIDGAVLSFIGRTPYVDGRPVDPDLIAPALYDAIDVAAAALFGGDWVNQVTRVLGLNRRTVTRRTLPPWALQILGRAAACETPRARGYLLMAAAEMLDAGPMVSGSVIARTRPADREGLRVLARRHLEEVLDLVALAWDAKRPSRGDQDPVNDAP